MDLLIQILKRHSFTMYFWQKLFIVSFLLKRGNYLLPRSVQFSWSVISDYLQPQWLQHSGPPCPSPTSMVYSNTCPLTWWWHPTISSSVVTVSSHLPSFPASGSFPMSHLFPSGGQSIGASASASVLPIDIQDWFPLGLTDLISLQSKGLLLLLLRKFQRF